MCHIFLICVFIDGHLGASIPGSRVYWTLLQCWWECKLIQPLWRIIPRFLKKLNTISSVRFSCPVMSDSLWPHRLQHTRPPCPSPTPRVYSNSCPSCWWCHPTISSSVVPFHLQSLPASGSFQMSHFFPSGGQSIGVSVSASVLPVNIQD